MAQEGNLFWYPGINTKWCDGEYDKGAMLDSYVRYFLARLQSMFKWDGLPETIPQKWLEAYLMCNGQCIIARDPKSEDLYAFFGGHGGKPDAYYIPTKYVVANPYLNVNKTYTLEGDEQDAVIIYNDTFAQGLIPLIRKACVKLVECDITLDNNVILARAALNISGADDNTRKSAELYLNRLRKGQLGVIAENPFLEGLNVREFTAAANSLTNIIEVMQYVKAGLYNDLGLNANYNMKRESINSKESQLNDDQLHPLIDDMLRERKEAAEKINALFGTNITVEFANAWESNEEEEQIIIDTQAAELEIAEAEAEKTEAETEATEAAAEATEEANEEATEDTNEETTEETTEEDAEDTEEDTEDTEESEEDEDNE